MKLVAIIGLCVLLSALVLGYSLQGKRISGRPGSFYLISSSIICAALLVSVVAIDGLVLFRDSLRNAYSGTGDLLEQIGGDPTASQLIAAQAPAFPKPSDPDAAAWQAWQNELRGHLADKVYNLDFSPPGRLDLSIHMKRQASDNALQRTEFAIPAVDGDTIPAVLLMPATTPALLPGILILHGHVRDGDSGLAQMVLPVKSYQQSAARQLALAGFATLTLELRGFGMRGPPNFPDHKIVAYNAILAGSFYKKLVFDDIKRAVDLLEQIPEIDSQRIGMSGVSLGAELTVEYSALDKRIRAISFHSHGGRTGPYKGHTNVDTAQPHYCHLIPGAARIMHREDPFLLLAPRPTQGIRGGREPFAEEEFVTGLKNLWSLLDKPDFLQLENVPDEGHSYFFEHAVEFFGQHL